MLYQYTSPAANVKTFDPLNVCAYHSGMANTAKYRDTPAKRILRQAMLNAPKLAAAADMPVNTVRDALNGKRQPRPSTRAKLADALRTHSDTLARLADQMEAGE